MKAAEGKTPKAVSNRQARVMALQVLYALEQGCGTVADALVAVLEEQEIPDGQRAFGARLVNLALEHRDEIRDEIRASVSNWDFDRIAMVDRVLVELGIAEIRMVPSTPVKVALSEYQSIARKFSTEDSPRFVGGVLNVVARKCTNIDSDSTSRPETTEG